MKSELEKLSGLTRRLNITVPQDVVSKALEDSYKEVQRVAEFKGFRQGKAPLQMVKAEYRSKVESDVASRIIQDHFGKALDQHALSPVNYPEIEFTGLKEGEPLQFAAVFEVKPEINLGTYTGLNIEKEILEVKNETVEQIIEDIRQSKASVVPVIEDRAAQMSDMAVIDFDGQMNGKPLQGGSGKEHMLHLGAKQFIPGFEEGVVGMKPNDTKVINLKFPDDYNPKELASQNVEFTVTLKELKKKVLPELNDEFAKTMGSHESLQQLKDEIKRDITLREEKRIRDDAKQRLLHALVDSTTFDVPQSMVAEQKAVLIDDVHHRMEEQGMPHDKFEEYKKQWDADFNKSAEFVIRSSLLVSAIAKKESLIATDEDLEAKMMSYAEQSGIEIPKIKAFYAKPENRSRLKFQITEDKVMGFLMEKAKVKEVEKSKLKPLPT